VTKPFGMDELLARMRAALRHQLQIHGERPIFHAGELSVDLVRRIIKVGGLWQRAIYQFRRSRRV
jgi:two-component system KDP operon response regulator KdpE